MSTYGYVRLNALHIPENFTIDDQTHVIRDYAKNNNLEVANIISDREQTSISLDMPGMKKLVNMAEKGEMDTLVVARLDRITRSVRKMSHFIEQLCIKHNVRLISIAEEFDSQKKSSQEVVNIIRIISKWDVKMISDRTKKLIRDKRQVGEYVGHAPFGFIYKSKKLLPYPKEVEIVKDIFRKRNIERASYHKIARFLNERRVPSKRGKKWYAETIKMIYKNPIYSSVDWNSFSSQDPKCMQQLLDGLQKLRAERE